MKNIISYGGGTQSTALILMGLNGEYDLPRPDFAVFADTDGEPQFIYDYVEYFTNYCKKNYDFDIYTIKHKDGLVEHLLNSKQKSRNGKFYTSSTPPFFTKDKNGKIGMLKRQCTSDFKIHPITKFINGKLGRGKKYRLWLGISFDERTRMKISPIKRRLNYYPLVENYIGRMDSVRYVKEKGLRTPQRSSCYFCPYHSPRYWRWLKNEHPDEFQKAVMFEKNIQAKQNDIMKSTPYIHKSCKPLDEVNLNQDSQMDLFPELIDECDGYCGV